MVQLRFVLVHLARGRSALAQRVQQAPSIEPIHRELLPLHQPTLLRVVRQLAAILPRECNAQHQKALSVRHVHLLCRSEGGPSAERPTHGTPRR